MEDFNKTFSELLDKCEQTLKDSDFPEKLGEQIKKTLEKQSSVFTEILNTLKTELQDDEEKENDNEELMSQETINDQFESIFEMISTLNINIINNIRKNNEIEDKLDDILLELAIIRKQTYKKL